MLAMQDGKPVLIRLPAGQQWIERQKEPIDGLNVIAVFIFAIAVMDGVPRHVMAVLRRLRSSCWR